MFLCLPCWYACFAASRALTASLYCTSCNTLNSFREYLWGSVQSTPDFNQACDELRRKLDWVNDEAMPKIFEMFARVHKMFNTDGGGNAAVGMSETMRKANEQMIRMQEMKMILTPFNLEVREACYVYITRLTSLQLDMYEAVSSSWYQMECMGIKYECMHTQMTCTG